ADELNCWLSDKPIMARPASAPEKLWRWSRRNPKTAGLGLTILLLLITLAIGSTVAAVRIQRAQKMAKDKLFESHVAQARAFRRTGSEGQRFESVAAVVKASGLRSTFELRSEAIACLALTDVRFTHSQQTPDPEHECYDSSLELRAFVTSN